MVKVKKCDQTPREEEIWKKSKVRTQLIQGGQLLRVPGYGWGNAVSFDYKNKDFFFTNIVVHTNIDINFTHSYIKT
jgi:hypothetical protein